MRIMSFEKPSYMKAVKMVVSIAKTSFLPAPSVKHVKFLPPEGEVSLLLFEKPAEQMTRKISIIFILPLPPTYGCFNSMLDTQKCGLVAASTC